MNRLRPPRDGVAQQLEVLVVVSVGGVRGAQARAVMLERGGAVASYGLPSPQAAHGVRRAIRVRRPEKTIGGADTRAGDSAGLALLPDDVPGARTAEGPRTSSPTEGAAGSRESECETAPSRVCAATTHGVGARSTVRTPHGRDPKAATMRTHRRISS